MQVIVIELYQRTIIPSQSVCTVCILYIQALGSPGCRLDDDGNFPDKTENISS